ncbi:integrase arm-type DNA-binding domain-containing protein [Methylopila sp. 73B]|uniref:tyrosine-type recombinase/integrase n=1 Tax=Methylopila sp. 73B TaxID=1120792 RepID=UPI0003821AA0|nr:integrase arm-type DNA-binding domain-containing protein [Methylopila sp. 73B]
MAKRELNRLTARTVATIKDAGRYADGGNLHLVVSPSGSKSWLMIYRHGGRQREMGLGPARDVTLAEAREKAADARRMLLGGLDPIEERRRQAEEVSRAAKRTPTFGEAADELIAAMSPSWRNSKHSAQWGMTLSRVRDAAGNLTDGGYCVAIRDKPVDEISTADVLEVLKPIWTSKPETASRLRGRIEAVLSAAKAQGLRFGENPALWRGHLDRLLPKRTKLSRGHHAAVPYADMPAFMIRLRAAPGMGARAVEFAILTAARSGEVRGATWSEIDMDARLWRVPPARMKAAAEHVVPLSEAAMAVLEAVQPLKRDSGSVIFPGPRSGAELSDMSLSAVLRRLKVDAVPHGFRSAFRDWAGDQTTFPREVAEAALAHTLRDAVERAYRRGTALEKRRELMTVWADYLQSAESHR